MSTGEKRRGSGETAGNRAILVGIAVSAVWLILVLVFFVLAPGDGTTPSGMGLLSVVSVIGPLALIWLSVGLGRAILALRAEAAGLRAEMEALRAGNAPEKPDAAAHPAPVPHPAHAQRRTQAAHPTVTASHRAAARPSQPQPAISPRPAPVAQARDENPQAELALEGTRPMTTEMDSSDVILALNFPDGPDDHAAVRALRQALRDPVASRLIRAAQDVITLLADRGLYMDDLIPEAPADPRLWRRFAAGERGPDLSGMGTIRDQDSLDIASQMICEDEVFRDVCHHFLRRFDRCATDLVPMLSDDELAALAYTRSARAFMLLARAAGMFG